MIMKVGVLGFRISEVLYKEVCVDCVFVVKAQFYKPVLLLSSSAVRQGYTHTHIYKEKKMSWLAVMCVNPF